MIKLSVAINERHLPQLLDRNEMKRLLLENEYGYMPDVPFEITVSEPTSVEKRYCAGTVEHSYVNMTVTSELGSHTFPVHRFLHTDKTVHPFFVFINFRDSVPDAYYPAEEIADEGFDVLSFCYKDVTSDDGDFSDGLAKVLLPDGQSSPNVCGKIIIWAWSAMRVLDYAQSLPQLDMSQAAVVGHSRLGKTALVTAMLDERFRYAISNDSGCSGAAVSRGKKGETIKDITDVFPHWFCKKYREYANKNFADEFDQHFLIAAIAPRFVYVASADMDEWADPYSEFISCAAASEAYRKMNLCGLQHSNRFPGIEEDLHGGRIGYHIRKGMHFLSRHDWQRFMRYIKLHQNEFM